MEIHFIDVGQGDSSLIVCPNGSTILIDAGSTADASPSQVRDYLVDVIEPLGLDIDHLVVTHPDTDHYNLIEDLLEGIPVGRAYYVGTRSDYRYPSLYDWVRTEPGTSKRLQFSDFDSAGRPSVEMDCGDADVWVLAASVSAPHSWKNAMSVVLMIRYGDFEAIMTGDATHATENIIMGRYSASWLDADVLKIGHHGSLATSTSKTWADTIKPQIAIASAAYNNSYGHPRKEVIDRLTPHTVDSDPHPMRSATRRTSGGPRYNFSTEEETEGVYSTSVNGTNKIESDGSGFQVFLSQGEE